MSHETKRCFTHFGTVNSENFARADFRETSHV